MFGLDKDSIIKEVKEIILRELVLDKDFKEKLLRVLGIKEDTIILKGENIKIEVIKNDRSRQK